MSAWFVCDLSAPLLVVFAVVSASMQQLLAVMHGLGTSGILPPEKGSQGLTAFILRSIFGVPEGDFVFDSEFNAAVAETSTSDAAFIVADLSRSLPRPAVF